MTRWLELASNWNWERFCRSLIYETSNEEIFLIVISFQLAMLWKNINQRRAFGMRRNDRTLSKIISVKHLVHLNFYHHQRFFILPICLSMLIEVLCNDLRSAIKYQWTQKSGSSRELAPTQCQTWTHVHRAALYWYSQSRHTIPKKMNWKMCRATWSTSMKTKFWPSAS